jgi:hypothetical protein
MNNKEFKKFVIETASKYFKEEKKGQRILKEEINNEGVDNITADQIKLLAEEMKKINKKIDLRNPIINPEFFDKIKKDNDTKKGKEERWKNLYEYKVVSDDDVI